MKLLALLALPFVFVVLAVCVLIDMAVESFERAKRSLK